MGVAEQKNWVVTMALKYRPNVAENTTAVPSRALMSFTTGAANKTLCLALVASASPELLIPAV